MQSTESSSRHVANGDRLRTVSRLVFFGFLAIAAFFLITEHRAHLYGWWPFLLVAACPLLHVFHGHGHHDGERAEGSAPSGKGSTSGES